MLRRNIQKGLRATRQLGAHATITLRACEAGWHRKGEKSIAQAIADTLEKTVYAWKVGLFFSADPNAIAMSKIYTKDPTKDPLYIQNHVMYLLPWGGYTPCTYTPHQPDPENCGGRK